MMILPSSVLFGGRSSVAVQILGAAGATLPPLPPQLLPSTSFDDPSAWTVAGGWSIAGGVATHTTGTGQFSKLTARNVPALGAATDIVITFDVVNQISEDTTHGVRGMIAGNTSNGGQYHGWWNQPNSSQPAVHRIIPHVSHIYNRTGAQNAVMMEANTLWAGSIDNVRLYDVSGHRDKPTITMIAGQQSNVVGFGQGNIIPELDRWHPDIWVCSPDNFGLYGAKANTIQIAQEPLVHSADPGHHVGPAMEAARRIVAATNGAVRVVIVPVGKTATGLLGSAAPWNPDSTLAVPDNRYDVMVATHAAAVAQISNHIGTVMLWSGQEADLNVLGWQTQLRPAILNFRDRARADLNAPNMQIVMLGAVVADPAAPSQLVQMQRTFGQDSGHANAIPGVHYFDGPLGQQWINTSDEVHFTTPANRIRGAGGGDLMVPIVMDMLTPRHAPAIADQPTILPAGAGIGDSITLDLGAASGSPAPTAAWTLTLDGADISNQVDNWLAMELVEAGDYALAVTWTNSVGSAVAATATLTVIADVVPPAFDRAASTWIDITPTTPITGTAAAVTGITAGGTGGLTIPTAAAGAEIQRTADGLLYSGSKYSAITTTPPISGGVILIAELRLTQGSDTGTAIDLGPNLYARQGGANLQYGYNFGAAAIVTAGPAVAGSWAVMAIELDRDAGTIRYWDGDEIITVTGIDASSFAPTQVRLGQSFLGAIRNASVATKTAGGAWTATLEQLLEAYGAGGAGVVPAGPAATRLRILPALIQSEARPDAGTMPAMLAGDNVRGWSITGLRDVNGSALPPWGAGAVAIDQAVPATRFAESSTVLLNRSSEVYSTQYSWLRGQPSTARALIGDNGFGGLYVEQYLLSTSGPIAENNLYYLQEVDRLAGLAGIPVECPYFYHFVGTSAKMQPYAQARSAIEDVWDELTSQAQALSGAAPKPVLVQTGGDVDTVTDLYQQVQAQYDLTVLRGGIIATHQRIWPIHDGNIHPDGPTGILIGEVCGIAIREVEAGRDWTVTATVTKSGATVTVAFDLRPGETLINRAGLYADYGGDAATCPHFGFEADGGIAAVAPNLAAGTVTITLNSASAAWLRFGLQRQDVSGHVAPDGTTMSAHRTTLFPSLTFQSESYPSATLWRSLPSFEGTFSGGAFSFGPTP